MGLAAQQHNRHRGRKPTVLIGVLFLTMFLFSFRSVAAIPTDLLTEITDLLINKDDKNLKDKKLSLDSTIELAPDGDENNNGQIDAGDIVRFTYTITNTTDKTFSYSSIKTQIDRNNLSFIHNVRGVTGVQDADGTIVFPHVRLSARETRTMSFDARINYFQEDTTVATEAEFIDAENKSVSKAERKEVRANKLTKEEIKERLKNRGITIQKQ
jgi:hypothetical protein